MFYAAWNSVIPNRRRGIPRPLALRLPPREIGRVRVAYNFYVYMLTNRWKNVLYTDVTNDLLRRGCEHRNKVHDGFTKMYNCGRLVYFEWYQDIRQAIERETQIKKWSRAKKDALVASMNPEWRDLSEEWNVPEAEDCSTRI
jgi:putative endonuclease